MKLTDRERLEIEALARNAAICHFTKNNADATEDDAWRFACRHWRSPEFLQVGIDVIAFGRAHAEKMAAPFN